MMEANLIVYGLKYKYITLQHNTSSHCGWMQSDDISLLNIDWLMLYSLGLETLRLVVFHVTVMRMAPCLRTVTRSRDNARANLASAVYAVLHVGMATLISLTKAAQVRTMSILVFDLTYQGCTGKQANISLWSHLSRLHR